MTTSEFLSSLRTQDIQLWVEGEKLCYSAPAGALTPKLAGELRKRKTEIIGLLRQAGDISLLILPVSRDSNLPLSFAQERLWFLDQLEPGSTVYTLPGAFRLKGPLNVSYLEQSLNEIVRRHEALRTTFKSEKGSPRQVITSGLTLPLPVVDLSNHIAKEREDQTQRLAVEEIERPFDLAQGPLMRMTLLRLDQEEHVLLLNMHHMVSDGWSMGVFFRELSVLYDAFRKGERSPLANLPVQYADYAVWQREWLKGEVLESQLSYWRKQLENVPTLQLPTDRPRPVVQTFRGARQSLILSEDLTDKLKTLSRKEEVTLFMALLAAFQTLLHRLTAQEDIVVGSPIAGRTRPEIEGLIGFFLNTLVLRTDLSGNPSFRELLVRVRQVALGAYEHQDVPFEKLLEELRPKRDLSRTPLFQVFFNMLNVEAPSVALSGLKIERLSHSEVESKFDVTIYVREQNGALQLNWVYNADLFEADRMTEILQQYQELLSQVAEDPDQRICSYSLLTKSAQRVLPNPVESLDSDWVGSVHDKLSQHARLNPDHVAITDPRGSWTYAELNARSNQLAHYLLANGIQREEIIAVYAHRSISLPWALLGVLKAGAAFLILDPAYPTARLIQYVRGAQPRGLISLDGAGAVPTDLERVFQAALRCRIALPRMSKPGAGKFFENCSSADPEIEIRPDDLAYISYTSGSTGEPKGVQGTHGPLSHFLPWQAAHFGLTCADRFSLLSGLSHDPLHREILTAFWVGATLCIPDPDFLGTSGELPAWMAQQRISFAHLTPALGRLLAESAKPESKWPSLRYAFFIGDKLTRRDIACLRRLAPQATNVNYYGSTETQRAVSYHEISPQADDAPGGSVLPVGHGMPGAQLLVLTRARNLTGIGEVGEIYMRSPHLARGYLGDPSRTQARFVTNPFTRQAHDRMYQTGDLGRYLRDGSVEVLGRTDGQVNIRGFRVETGELEFALSQCPAVRDVVVVARDDAGGDKQLIAYVVAAQEPALSIHQLRSFLKQRLPDHMMPSAFVTLESLPLTPNGKVDRKALPPPDSRRLEQDEDVSGPRTPLEEMLAGIWAEVFKIDKVGIHDNFFDLGGHSLLATRVMSGMRRAFEVELPLRALFESPTVSELAARIEAVRREENGLITPPFVPLPRESELPLSFAQERLWFLDQLEPGSSVYNMSGAFRLSGRLCTEALERSLNEIVRRHEALRTTFQSVEGFPWQEVAAELIVPLPVIDLSDESNRARDEKASSCAAEAARQPFDLSRGPLVRTTLLRLGEENHVLLLSMHHIVSDGWSMAIFFRELSALYETFANGKPSPLPELPIQYADYAVWQRNWLKGEVLETQLSYWRKQLKNIAPLNLVTDRPRPPIQTFHGGRESLVLSKDLTQVLKRISRKQGASLFMTLLAVLQLLLHRLTGQEDIAVGSPIAGRNRAEIESLIGCFLNTLVLRTKLQGNPAFTELLAQVRGVCLDAYAHQEVPFEKLLEELRPERDLSRTPLFQILFNMLNVAGRVEPAGLAIETVPVGEVESKFDLTIYVREHDGALQFNWVYNADLFEPDRIREMSRQYEKLLTQISEDSGKSIGAYSLLTSAAQELLPDPTLPLAANWVGSVHDRFAHQAKCLPDHIAITDPSGSWTYKDLDLRSNQLAHYLLQSGIQREDIVAVYAHRSAPLVWALLGILKAGAAFLILDPAYPAARLIQYVRAAKPRGLISLDAAGALSNELESVLQATVHCRVTLPRLSELGPGNLFESYPTADPAIEIRPDDLAYLSYTSGSTGEPKGVQGTHGPLSHFLPWQVAHFALTSADRFSLLSGLSHDPLHREILTALWVGGTICVPDPDLLGASGQLPAWMARQQITFAHLTPALGKLLTESAGPQSQLRSLRYLFFVGDKLTWTDIARMRRLAPKATSVNYYGSTETQRAVSYYEIPALEENEPCEITVPIGRGMPDAQLLVLTRARALAGLGEVGEIYMRSPHLARGYLDDPALTQARFLTNPFTRQAHDRLYQTGDLGRYLRDGNVEVLGRTDGQINIRGFRVEPGEIEFALRQYPLVREAVVIAREDLAGDKPLVAYLVAAEGRPPPAHRELRSFLKQRMPDYMIPSAFVLLDSLPLTPNGKVDRKAVLAADPSGTEREEPFVGPRTPIEKTLAQIWAEVLKLDAIGVHENFFDLGGHSLLATQIISRLRDGFSLDFPLRALFEDPTVAGLAARIAVLQAKRSHPEQLAEVLTSLESCSDEEAELLLSQENSKAI